VWDLDGLAARYRAVLADADRRTSQAEEQPAAGAAAFRAFAAAALPLYQTSSDDPDLPDELLPATWPRGTARELFVACYDLLGPIATRRVRQVIARFSPELAVRAAYHNSALVMSDAVA